MAKPTILFISTELPFPPRSGGKMKSWKYVEDLSKRYDLSIACLLKEDDSQYIDEFKQAINIEQLITQELQISRNPISLIKSYLGFPCLNVFRNFSTVFKRKIHSIIDNFDIVIVDHYEVFQYLPKNYKGKIIMHTHNAEFMLWERMSSLSNNPFLKLILNLEAHRVKSYEKKIFSKAQLIFSTPSDIELYEKNNFDISKHRTTYHLGNDDLLSKPTLKYEETEGALCFIGTLSWEPNIDGLLWFIKDVWPLVIKEKPTTCFYILGKKGDKRIYEVAKPYQNIIFTGFINDLDHYLKKSTAYVVPLRFGSGMKVKVLDGLYRGSPMVSTAVGVEGLALENGKHFLLANDSEDFANACITLLNDQKLWSALSQNSRKIAQEKYRWKPLFEQMNQELINLFSN